MSHHFTLFLALFFTANLSHHQVSAEANKAQQVSRLDCQPGEQRHFNYESSTQVWGSTSQLVHLRASIRIRCMEAPSNISVKYMAEILSLAPAHGDEEIIEKNSKAASALRLNPARSHLDVNLARAEPVLEEVGEAISVAADRVKRSVSGWFSKTWVSVKDFFGNIFSSSEKTTISREQAFSESGLDIGHQCKAGKGKTPGNLPIDDSVFDDLEPKYYIGASLDPSTAYEFDNNNNNQNGVEEDQEEFELSFFDDPKPKSASRSKRATSGKAKTNSDYDRLLRLPFEFIQSRMGKILEVRFSSDESDVTVKNFKRHLCDLFATNLDKDKSQLSEMTPTGQHNTKYLLDPSSDSSAIKQTLTKFGNQDGQLVRALATVGMQPPAKMSDSVEGRQPGQANLLAEGLSVLRSINSTRQIQLNSKTLAPDIEKMQLRFKQVQQISEGRMTGSAGQLSMSLIQPDSKRRSARSSSSATNKDSDKTADMAELIQVSSSFSVQLVPVSKLGKFAEMKLAANTNLGELSARLKRSTASNESSVEMDSKKSSTGDKEQFKQVEKTKAANGQQQSNSTTKPAELLVIKPADAAQLQKTLREWRQLETQLQFSATNVASETGSQSDSQLDRLEILRDQIQMRLNEEFLRNRMRRASILARQQVAALLASSRQSATPDGTSSSHAKGNDLGLSLTQLVLENGITSRQKGSIYTTIEEVLELEANLGEDADDRSMSRLLRDTARMDKLRARCKSAIAKPSEIRSGAARLQLRSPFEAASESAPAELLADERLSQVISGLKEKNSKKLEQCKQVAQLLLRVSERQASNLVLDLIDECNSRMIACAKDEELGYGPASRYYRQLRQQFIELMSNINKPSESTIERLMNRLYYPSLSDPQRAAGGTRRKVASNPQQEFTFVTKDAPSEANFNKTLLREDDYNNNDAAGSLVMTITSLAAKPSIGRAKRVEIAEKLLLTLKSTSCSLFSGPDLDILESMGNFQEPLEEIVGKIVHLARRCRHQDQYLIACVHALQGQLEHSATQRFLSELLRSQNASCTVKSEVVLTLINAIVISDLNVIQTSQTGQMNNNNEIPPAAQGQSKSWPSFGLNKVDDVLLDLLDDKNTKRNLQDSKCLRHLIIYYMSKKRQMSNDIAPGRVEQVERRRARRQRRFAVINDDSFWDEAQCKRWVLPASNSSFDDMAEEMDDNSIIHSLATGSNHTQAKNQKLVERESDPNSSASKTPAIIRRRHKCSASKTYGPKNAEAILRAEIVNDLLGDKDENKFLARFRLAARFLGNKIDVGRMYLWHQRQMTRAHVNIMGKSLWDTSHSCQDKAPRHLLYVPLFDFNLWLLKVSVGLRLHSEMGFFSNCDLSAIGKPDKRAQQAAAKLSERPDELELYPTISLRASGEASAKFVVVRAGMSLASQYGYQGNIRVSRQPESCMSIYSAHQPMNVTFSSWIQLWDNDCHFWGSRNKAEPQATKWRLAARKPTAWLEDECLAQPGNGTTERGSLTGSPTQSISP